MSRVAFKQCDAERMIRAAKREGLIVTGLEQDPDTGAVRVLTGDAPARQMTATEKWKAAQDAKRQNEGR